MRHGHIVHEVSELAAAAAIDPLEILKQAEKRQWDILTRDGTLAMAPFEHGFPFRRLMVYLQLEGGDVEQDDAVDRLFERYKRLSVGRLYTVTATRVKIRQLPLKWRAGRNVTGSWHVDARGTQVCLALDAAAPGALTMISKEKGLWRACQ